MPPSMMSYNSKHSKTFSNEREGKKENDEDNGCEAVDGGGSMMVIT